jgi:hypothetical protein
MLQPKKDKDAFEEAEEHDDASDDEEEEEEDDVFDMPPPWSPKIYLDKDKFLNLCPLGEKTVFYKKSRVDFYAD